VPFTPPPTPQFVNASSTRSSSLPGGGAIPSSEKRFQLVLICAPVWSL